jgi:FtsZ-binding cell division protein ZapB
VTIEIWFGVSSMAVLLVSLYASSKINQYKLDIEELKGKNKKLKDDNQLLNAILDKAYEMKQSKNKKKQNNN